MSIHKNKLFIQLIFEFIAAVLIPVTNLDLDYPFCLKLPITCRFETGNNKKINYVLRISANKNDINIFFFFKWSPITRSYIWLHKQKFKNTRRNARSSIISYWPQALPRRHEDGEFKTCELCPSFIRSVDNMCGQYSSVLCYDCTKGLIHCITCGQSICGACQIYPDISTDICVSCWIEPECDNNFHSKTEWLKRHHSKIGYHLHNLILTTLLIFNTFNPKLCHNTRSLVFYWLFIDITKQSQLTDSRCQYGFGCGYPIFGLTNDIYCQGCQQKYTNYKLLTKGVDDSDETDDDMTDES